MKKGILKHHKTVALQALIILIIGLMSIPVFGATYYTRQSGNWDSRWTWSTIAFRGAAAASTPGPGDNVIIDRYEVTVSAINVTVATVQVLNSVGFYGVPVKLTIQNGRKLTTTGDFTMTMNNTVSTVTLDLRDNSSELEVLGNLNFTRSANTFHNKEFIFTMQNNSMVTVFGDYIVNSPDSGPYLFESLFEQRDNAIFRCKANVVINIADIGSHIILTDASSTWQVDGNVTVNHDGDEAFWMFCSTTSTLQINGNLNINLNGLGGVEIGVDNTAGADQLRVLGDLFIDNNSGGNVRVRNANEGDLKVDGDFTIDWDGSSGANKKIYFKCTGNSTIDVTGTLNIDMNDPNNGNINLVFLDNSKLNIGTNNGQFLESAIINLANGNSLIMDLDGDSKMTVFGDLTTTSNGTGDVQFRLNENINGASTDGQLEVQGDWSITKTNGKSFNLIVRNNSDIVVQDNLIISNTGFNNDLVVKENKISVFNDGKLEVWDNFSWNTNDAAQRVQPIIDLQDNAQMNTGTLTNNFTSLTATNAESMLITLAGASRWNVSGDFNFECLSVTSASMMRLNGSSQFHIGRHLKFDNTSNNNSIQIQLLGSNLMTVKQNIDFTKVFRQHGGVINISSGKLKLGGSMVRNAAPNKYGYIEVENNGSATLEFNGTAPQVIPKALGATLNGNKEFGVLFLNNSSNISPQFTLEGDVDINSLEISANNTLNISSEKSMTVDTKITNNGVITVENNGAIVQTSVGANTNTGNGIFHIKRAGKISIDKYNIWSSPITSANLVTVFEGSNPCDIYVFEAPTQTWSYDYAVGFNTSCNGNQVVFGAGNVITGGDGNMDVARGYFAPGNPSSSRTFSGTINNGTVTTPIVTTNLGNNQAWNNDDWNLVGNPYPSAVNALDFWTENAVNNNRITDGIFYWDESDPVAGANAIADYAYWNMAGGVNSGNSNKMPNGNISSGQGFWVVANANTNLVFTNAMRSKVNNQFFKSDNVQENHNAWLSMTSPSGIENNILIGFNPKATDAIDPFYDAHKLEGNPNLRFASVINNEEFVIQSQSMIKEGETRVIPLVVFSNESGNHTFSEYKRQDLSINYKIYLRDNDLGIVHELSIGNYTINLQANTEYLTRFELVIHFEKGVVLSTESDGLSALGEKIKTSNFTIIPQDGLLTIMNQNNLTGVVQVFDLTGKLLIQNNLIGSSVTLNAWSNLPSGSYVISISNNGESMFRKNEIKM